MELPLSTLAEHLGIAMGKDTEDVSISGLRLLTANTRRLEPGILYIGYAPADDASCSPGCAMLLTGERRGQPACPTLYAKGAPEEWLNTVSESMDCFAAWEERIKQLLWNRELDALMSLISEILGNAAYMVDSSFRVLAIDKNNLFAQISAIWKHLVEHEYIPYDILTGLRHSGEMKAMRRHESATVFYSEYFNNPFINLCLRRDGKLWGHFFLVGYCRNISRGDLAYVQRLGKLLDEAPGIYENTASIRARAHEDFFLHVMDGSQADRSQISRQLQPLGWDMEWRYQVLCLDMGEGSDMLAALLCDKLETAFECRAIQWQGGVAAVFPIADFEAAGELEARLRDFVMLTAVSGGLSDVFDGFYRLPRHCIQAQNAIRLGGGQERRLYTFRATAVPGLLRELKPDFDPDIFCDKAVFRLRDYDSEHEGEYLHTLFQYLRCERNIAETARRLFIHRNTLIYRIERIEKLTGLELDDPDVRERVLLSCRIMGIGE